MRRLIFTFFCGILLASAVALHAQVSASATKSRPALSVGIEFSAAQPDFDDETSTIKSSDDHIFGGGIFVDYRMSRWVQIEAEGRKLHWNQYNNERTHESNYLFGLREPIHTYGRITPYGKVLAGIGGGNFLTGHPFAYAIGGGADYRFSKRWSVRADFEYQHWKVAPTAMKPYIGSIGLKYDIFK
jgi:opacity protein-like surface antigen